MASVAIVLQLLCDMGWVLVLLLQLPWHHASLAVLVNKVKGAKASDHALLYVFLTCTYIITS